MKHINEIELEKIVLNKTEINMLPNELALHFSECKMCRSKYDYFNKYYNTLNIESIDISECKVDDFIEQQIVGKPVQLQYFTAASIHEDFLSENGSIVLAAKTNDSVGSRFRTEAVYVDIEGDWIVRIMIDEQLETNLFYLLSGKNNSISNRTLKIFSESEEPIIIITNENGSAEKQVRAVKWDKIKIVLMP